MKSQHRFIPELRPPTPLTDGRYSRLRRTLRVNFRWNYWRQTKTTCVRN